MPTTEAVACPKCGGPTWDNRLTKRNPKAPDYKCKDATCDGAVWPPKNGVPPRAAAPAATAKQAYTSGPALPYEGSDKPMTWEKLDAQFAIYDLCLAHAHSAATRLFGQDVTDEAVCRVAATLYIQAVKVTT